MNIIWCIMLVITYFFPSPPHFERVWLRPVHRYTQHVPVTTAYLIQTSTLHWKPLGLLYCWTVHKLTSLLGFTRQTKIQLQHHKCSKNRTTFTPAMLAVYTPPSLSDHRVEVHCVAASDWSTFNRARCKGLGLGLGRLVNYVAGSDWWTAWLFLIGQFPYLRHRYCLLIYNRTWQEVAWTSISQTRSARVPNRLCHR